MVVSFLFPLRPVRDRDLMVAPLLFPLRPMYDRKLMVTSLLFRREGWLAAEEGSSSDV